MKFTKTIQASQDFIFQTIINSALYDIKQATGRQLDLSALTGFEYQKTIQGQSTTIKIDEATAPSVYAFTTTAKLRVYTTRWELRPVNDKATEVSVEDTQSSSSLIQGFVDKIMTFFIKRMKHNQLDVMLTKMEQEYRKSNLSENFSSFLS